MYKATCNAELCFTFPDGFSKLDEEVKRRMGISGNDQVEMFSDPERHMLINVGWRPMNLAGRLNTVKDMMKSVEAGISKQMQPYGYRYVTESALEVDGVKAEVMEYEYTAEGIDMFGETVVIKANKIMYNIHLYARKELKETSLETWHEILDSVKWV